HPWENAPGVVANRVALEACIQARNERRDLACEGNEIIREASKWSPEIAISCEVWKERESESAFSAQMARNLIQLDTLSLNGKMQRVFDRCHAKRALVERWRLETHTFHLPCDKCTTTLEDIALQLSLPMNGPVIMGSAMVWRKVDSAWECWGRSQTVLKMVKYRSTVVGLMANIVSMSQSDIPIHIPVGD
ncbi:hypothetical protein Golob_007602, partial [Gossypium lobatum]|nr:hypothetical protein [Gossypium lobatum]